MLTGVEQRALEKARARQWVERKLRNRIRYERRMRRIYPRRRVEAWLQACKRRLVAELPEGFPDFRLVMRG